MRTLQSIAAATVGLLFQLFVTNATAQTNLITNSSFEIPSNAGFLVFDPHQIASWTFSESAPCSYQLGYDNVGGASDGDRWVTLYSCELGGPSTRTLTSDPFAVVPNAQYQLSFDLRPINNGGNYAATIEVLVNGVVMGTYLHSASEPIVWTPHSIAFDVPVSSAQVAFRVSANGPVLGDGWYAGLDNVTVSNAPIWWPTGSMSSARSDFTATLLTDGRVLVSGGSGLASAEIYIPALGTWTLTGSMSRARFAHTATLLKDGRVLVSGGDSSSTEIYTPALGTWTLTGSMSTARYAAKATLLADGRVLVSGGEDAFSFSALASAEIYDPALGTWTVTSSMSIPRGYSLNTLLPDGRVLVSGGNGGGTIVNSAEIYDPALGTWSPTGSMNTARSSVTPSAILLPDGRVLVEGGSGSFPSASAEIYDPTVGTWSLTASMNIARAVHTATLLPDGRVLVSGGYDGIFVSATAEIYDPALGTWSLTAPMTTAGRIDHTATLLKDGRVLVSGGAGCCSDLASAEIFGKDGTPPQVSCGAADGAWHKSDATIACTASDPESGLANAADASFTLTTSVASGTETANAATNSRQLCNTLGLCTTAGPITGNKVDKKGPAIAINSPAAGATYQLNASVGASYSCVDGGSGLASCQGSVANGNAIDTSSTGTKTFTVTSTDVTGNPSTLTVTYSVVSGGGGGATSADVGIAMSAPQKIAPGGTLMYSITVTNSSKVTATGIVMSDALPAGTVFARASASQGTVSAPAVGSNGTVTANLGSLANGATATISVVVTVTAPSGSGLTNTATVTATTQDLNTANNTATQKTKVQ